MRRWSRRRRRKESEAEARAEEEETKEAKVSRYPFNRCADFSASVKGIDENVG